MALEIELAVLLTYLAVKNYMQLLVVTWLSEETWLSGVTWLSGETCAPSEI